MALRFMRIPMPGRAIQRLIVYALFLAIVTVLTASGWFYRGDIQIRTNRYLSGQAADYFKIPFNYSNVDAHHPIDWLVHEARAGHAKLLEKRSQTTSMAARRYRERRGRHPPPGFEPWVRNALSTDSLIIEEFFDRVYHDLRPFWAVEAHTLRDQAGRRPDVISIRSGALVYPGGKGNKPKGRAGPPLWWELVGEIAQYLPDMDIPINMAGEPRILVPWEEIDKLVKEEGKNRAMPRKADTVPEFSAREDGPPGDFLKIEWLDKTEHKSAFWDVVRAGCAPDSPSRGVEAAHDEFKDAPQLPYTWEAPFAHKGYVLNYTGAVDPCVQPHLRMLHSEFIEPRSVNTTKDLVPIFSGGKLHVNNDILLPSPAYLGNREHVNRIAQLLGRKWTAKENALVFTGIGSGGRDGDSPWRHFHRQRLVEMLNGTVVGRIEEGKVSRGATFDFPPPAAYDTDRRQKKNLGSFLSGFARAQFTLFACGDGAKLTKNPCDNLAGHVPAAPAAPARSNAEVMSNAGVGFGPTLADYNAKYLPIVDRERGEGGVAARFRATLLSTSVPLKATVFAEWHDDRLVPWLHYVPIDNTFRDLYAVLDYFTNGDAARDGSAEGYLGRVGVRKVKRGDKAARWIAESGRAWAARVLRREDMRLYVWRLLLEWARLCDENRDKLGYVEDLP